MRECEGREKFSVLISVYFKETPKFLEKALDSIFNQTLKPDEVVLVKDGILTKELEEVISVEKDKFNKNNIGFVCVQLEKNMGLGIALQKGLEKCKYDYVARMDADDIATDTRFEYQMKYMNEHKDISVLGGYIDEFSVEGEVIGGNIRCFLKLAGTRYFPEVENKVLFIEGLGTSVEGLITHLSQLKQMNVFCNISGLLIGTFTKIEKEISVEELFELVKEYIPEHLPVVKTSEIGHAKDSKALKIGGMINIKNELV